MSKRARGCVFAANDEVRSWQRYFLKFSSTCRRLKVGPLTGKSRLKSLLGGGAMLVLVSALVGSYPGNWWGLVVELHPLNGVNRLELRNA